MSNKPTNRKKVLFLITKSNWGGAQRYVYDLATHLDVTQFEPVVVLGGSGPLAELLTHAGIRTIRMDSLRRDIGLKHDWQFARELWRLLKDERPDILHVNSSKAGGIGALFGRLQRIPRIIFTAHGWAFNEDRPYWQRLLITVLHWTTVLLSHRTIAVSQGMRAQLRLPGAQQRMRVIHPGRTIGVMYSRTDARTKLYQTATSLDPSKRRVWVGTIAELHPIKQLDVLIRAAAQLTTDHPELQFVIIGDGELRNKLSKEIEYQKLTGTVVLTGEILDAARFLNAFDYFVLPSRSESYGYVLHEAGLAGLPVVASKVGGIPDIIQDQKTGLLVESGNVTALVTALKRLVHDQALRERLAHELQIQMRERTVEKMTRATEAIYTL